MQLVCARREVHMGIDHALQRLGYQPRTVAAAGPDPYRMMYSLAGAMLARVLAEDGAGRRSFAALLADCGDGAPAQQLLMVASGAAVHAATTYGMLLGNEEQIMAVVAQCKARVQELP